MRDIDFDSIGRRIRERRIELHLTQENLADAVDVNVSHISNIETHKVKISLSLLVKVCSVLNTTVDYILADELDEESTPLEKELRKIFNSLTRDKQEILLRISKVI